MIVKNLTQAASVARKHIQSIHPRRWVQLVGEGHWTGEAWHVEVAVGVIANKHHFVLQVYPNGKIKQISHATS